MSCRSVFLCLVLLFAVVGAVEAQVLPPPGGGTGGGTGGGGSSPVNYPQGALNPEKFVLYQILEKKSNSTTVTHDPATLTDSSGVCTISVEDTCISQAYELVTSATVSVSSTEIDDEDIVRLSMNYSLDEAYINGVAQTALSTRWGGGGRGASVYNTIISDEDYTHKSNVDYGWFWQCTNYAVGGDSDYIVDHEVEFDPVGADSFIDDQGEYEYYYIKSFRGGDPEADSWIDFVYRRRKPSPAVDPEPPTPGCETCGKGAAAEPGMTAFCPPEELTSHGDFVDFSFSGSGGGCSSCGGMASGGGGMPMLQIDRHFYPDQDQELTNLTGGHAFGFDHRIQIFPGTPNVLHLWDATYGRKIEYEDSNSDGTYEPAIANFFGDITLKNSSGTTVTDPTTLSSTNPLFATAVRRDGTAYKFELVDAPVNSSDPLTPIGRLLTITDREGFVTTLAYKTFTASEILSSPRRQLQIDTITDPAGNVAEFTYNSAQQAGRWVVSQIDINSGDDVLDYAYSDDELLSEVKRNSVVKSSYGYGVDDDWQATTVTYNEVTWSSNQKDTLLLTQDTMLWGGSVITQVPGLLLGRANGLGERYLIIMRHDSTADLSRVYYRGQAFEWYRGRYLRYFEDFFQAGASGFDSFGGTLETSYAENVGTTAANVLSGLHPTLRDEHGYVRTVTYSSGSVATVTHPDSTYEKYLYDSNNQITYARDRRGNVTTYERDSNNHLVKVAMGLTDTSGSGTPTANTGVSVQKIYGYYTSGANEGLLQWQGQEAYSSGSVTAPAANTRTDYSYTGGFLTAVTKPLPAGQSTRPTIGYTWVDGHLTQTTNENSQVTIFTEDELGRNIQTLYADGSKDQTWYDDYNVYTKNRVDVVDYTERDDAGRVLKQVRAYGHDTNLADETISTVHGVNDSHTTLYGYDHGETSARYTITDGSMTEVNQDYRGRGYRTVVYPNTTMERVTERIYENNRLLCVEEKFGTYVKRQYAGYSSNGLQVRSIATRDSTITFADNAAVMAATRITGADPAHAITDAVRDVAGNIVQLVDAAGTITTQVYDQLDRQTSTTRATGTSLEDTSSQTYDSHSNVLTTTDWAGTVTSMTYDLADNLLTKTLAYGTSIAATWSYTYTPDSKQATETMPNTGVNYSYYTSCCGEFAGSKDALGDGQISNVDAIGRTVHSAVVEDYASHTNTYNPIDAKTFGETTTKYRDDGRIAASTTWNVALGTIDPSNPPIAGLNGVTASNGITTQYVYDNQIGDGVGLDSSGGITINRLGGGTAAINIQAAVMQLADTIANGGGNIALGTNRQGKATVVISPDEKSMRVSISDAAGRSVFSALMSGPAATTPNQLENWSAKVHDQAYSVAGIGVCEATWAVARDGNYTQYVANGMGANVISLDQDANVARQRFDAAGRMVESIDRLSKSTEYEYDLLGRQTKVTDPLGRETTQTYSESTGRVTSVTDAKGSLTSYTYDPLGKLLTTTDRNGKVTTKAYDEMGLLASITDAESKTTAYDHDLTGRKNRTTYSDATEMTVDAFDAAGRPLVVTKPSGRQIVNSYNLNGTRSQIHYKNSSGTVTNTETYTYDNYGRKTGSSSTLYNVSLERSYDDFGRLLTESVTYSGVTYTATYGYNSKGRRSSVTYPSGDMVEYTYNDRGLLDSIDWESTEIENRSYNANGLLTSINRASEDETRVYDDASQLTSISSTNTGSMTYTYDDNGNVLSETLSGVMANYSFTTEKSGTGTYPDGYDNEDRFMRFIRNGVSEDSLLARSDVGNISSLTLNGTAITNRTYNNVHALTTLGAESQSYDDDCNATTLHTGVTVEWDDAGMIKATHVSSSATAGIEGDNEYGYLDGKKVWSKITRSGSVVAHHVYVHSGLNRIAEYNANAAPASPQRQRIFAEGIDSLVYFIRDNGDVLVPVQNRQRSVVALVDNSNGNILERYAYDQFGERTVYAANGTTMRSASSYSNNHGYTSREHLVESGIMYFRARHYDQHVGEFLSRDPMEFVDGNSAFSAYFIINGIDPLGLEFLPSEPVTITPISGNLAKGSCNARKFTPYQTWKWGFSKTLPREPGWVIQKVSVSCGVSACTSGKFTEKSTCGTIVTKSCCCNATRNHRFEYYEAWRVNSGKIPGNPESPISLRYNDKAFYKMGKNIVSNKCGSYRQEGTVVFFPDSSIGGDLRTMEGWSNTGGYFGNNTPCRTTAGKLYARDGKTEPSFWWLHAPGIFDQASTREFGIDFRCCLCEDMKKYSGIFPYAKPTTSDATNETVRNGCTSEIISMNPHKYPEN